jgi:prepilin-type N-terminal cleavage/methylation domain-containing protein
VRPPPDDGSRNGFTLLESLVALVVVALALLLGYGFMMRQPQAIQRLDAGDEALRAIEASLETLRAGEIPLESGFLEPGIAYPPPQRAAELVVDLDVTSTEIPGLYALNVEARYRVGRSIQQRRVETMVWSP